MEPEHRRWLQTLLAACEHAAMEVRRHDDPPVRWLLADIDDLRARLEGELRADERKTDL